MTIDFTLFKLQQILSYKNLEYPLSTIKSIFEELDFSLVASLKFLRKKIVDRMDQMNHLVATIDKTIKAIHEREDAKMIDSGIYHGFAAEENEGIRAEAKNCYGEALVSQTEDKIRQLGVGDWQVHREEGESLYQLLADHMDLPADSPQVQVYIKKLNQHLRFYWNVDIGAFAGLVEMYVEDERFSQYFDGYSEGIARYIRAAVGEYVSD